MEHRKSDKRICQRRVNGGIRKRKNKQDRQTDRHTTDRNWSLGKQSRWCERYEKSPSFTLPTSRTYSPPQHYVCHVLHPVVCQTTDEFLPCTGYSPRRWNGQPLITVEYRISVFGISWSTRRTLEVLLYALTMAEKSLADGQLWWRKEVLNVPFSTLRHEDRPQKQFFPWPKKSSPSFFAYDSHPWICIEEGIVDRLDTDEWNTGPDTNLLQGFQESFATSDCKTRYEELDSTTMGRYN